MTVKWVEDRIPLHLSKMVQGVVRRELLKQYRETRTTNQTAKKVE